MSAIDCDRALCACHELDPCPFCGAEPDWRMYPIPAVFCDPCGFAIEKNTAHAAAELWNTRPGEDRAFDNGLEEGMAEMAPR